MENVSLHVHHHRIAQPKVAIAFGIGRLHFVQAAEVLVCNGVDLTIATEETGLPAGHDSEARIVTANDSQALFQGIVTLADDVARREKLGHATADMMAGAYTWADYGRKVTALYGRLLITDHTSKASS